MQALLMRLMFVAAPGEGWCCADSERSNATFFNKRGQNISRGGCCFSTCLEIAVDKVFWFFLDHFPSLVHSAPTSLCFEGFPSQCHQNKVELHITLGILQIVSQCALKTRPFLFVCIWVCVHHSKVLPESLITILLPCIDFRPTFQDVLFFAAYQHTSIVFHPVLTHTHTRTRTCTPTDTHTHTQKSEDIFSLIMTINPMSHSTKSANKLKHGWKAVII